MSKISERDMEKIVESFGRVTAYPDTDEIIDQTNQDSGLHYAVIILVKEATQKNKAAAIKISRGEDSLAGILNELSAPYADHVEFEPEKRQLANRARLINNLFENDLIDEKLISNFEALSDNELCRRAMKLFKRIDHMGYNSSLIEDIFHEGLARKQGYRQLILGRDGNFPLNSNVDAIKFFITREPSVKGVILFEDRQVERFLKENGKSLLGHLRKKATRDEIITATKKFVTKYQDKFPQAQKLAQRKTQTAEK